VLFLFFLGSSYWSPKPSSRLHIIAACLEFNTHETKTKLPENQNHKHHQHVPEQNSEAEHKQTSLFPG
jgi:hypothetical protein